jgi:hypothetical protein
MRLADKAGMGTVRHVGARPPTHLSKDPIMANRLVSLVALAVAAGAMAALRRSSRAQRALQAPKAPPVPMQTWEGEGGALPATGSHMGPEPAVTGSVDDDVRRDDVITGIH